jgi:hypothetical protein
MTITLKNDFHNTQIGLKSRHGHRLSPSQVAKARKVLCGIDGCTCGGHCGERGPQWTSDHAAKITIEPTEDGGANLALEAWA